MNETHQNYKRVVDDLIEDQDPAGWASWLFNIQSHLISYGHFEGMDKHGASEESGRLWQLKTFFEEIGKLKK